MKETIDIIKEKLSPCFEALVKTWFPDGKMQGLNEYLIRNPAKDDKHLGSFSICFDKKFGYDFATHRYYDIVGLYAIRQSISNKEAAAHLMTLCESMNQRSAFRGNSLQYRKQASKTLCEPNIAPKPFDTQMMRHRYLGQPCSTYVYRNSGGSLIGYTARFLATDDSKQKKIMPMSWVIEGGIGRWRWTEQGWNGTKPIYGIEKLLKNLGKPVLITEGEKTCDAAQRIFPEIVCVSWRGGAASAGRAPWERLANRTVAIWPDQDEAGLGAAERILKILPNIEIISPPNWKPSGWDLADAEEEEIPQGKLLAHIARGAPSFFSCLHS